MPHAQSLEIQDAKDTYLAIQEMSQLLDTQLHPEVLGICIQLLEAGINPDSLASCMQALQKELATLNTDNDHNTINQNQNSQK